MSEIDNANFIEKDKCYLVYDDFGDFRGVVLTADVAPVVHGTWVRTGQSFFKADKFICYSCSVCGFDIEKTKYQYCPHCGARMDGGE